MASDKLSKEEIKSRLKSMNPDQMRELIVELYREVAT